LTFITISDRKKVHDYSTYFEQILRTNSLHILNFVIMARDRINHNIMFFWCRTIKEKKNNLIIIIYCRLFHETPRAKIILILEKTISILHNFFETLFYENNKPRFFWCFHIFSDLYTKSSYLYILAFNYTILIILYYLDIYTFYNIFTYTY